VQCSSLSEQFFDHHYKQIIIPNKHRVLSLDLLNRSQIYTSFTSHTFDASFHRLESVVLHGIKQNEFITVLSSLTILPRLFSLNTHLEDPLYDFNQVYRLILFLPVLKYNKLSAAISDCAVQNLVPVINNEQFSSIEQLVIDHPFSLPGLIVILSYTPRLCRLSSDYLFLFETMFETEIPIRSLNLTHLSIKLYCLQFDQFEMSIRKISSQLRVLRCIAYSNSTYLDADRWEQLISCHMPHLRTFIFEYHDSSFDRFELRPYHSFFDHFTSSFWTERRLLFDMNIDMNNWSLQKTKYCIYPFK
jgi:hypothetical protein